MHETIEITLLAMLAALGVTIGWWSARLSRWPRHESTMRPDAVHTLQDEPMCRPPEFGPLMQPRAVIDRIRDAIVEDQLGARKESPKQRRQRMQRYRGYTDRQRVQHWLLHWREDYMAGLTGRAMEWSPI